MRKGRNAGKKLMAVTIVKHALEIIHLLTEQNPIQVRVSVHKTTVAMLVFIVKLFSQVVVDAVVNAGPREDSTRVGSAGVVRRQGVDVSPFRRINQALYLLTTGARESSFRNVKTIAECLVRFGA